MPRPLHRLTPALVPALGLCTAIVLGAAAPAARPGANADWPQWRGPNRDAVAAESGLIAQWPETGPALLWKAGGLGTGFSSLALAGDRIYTLGDRESGQHLVAVNRADGKQVWATRLGGIWEDQFAGPRSTPTVDGDRVYALGTEGDLVASRPRRARRSGAATWRRTSAAR